MGQSKKGRQKADKNKKPQTWVNQYEAISVRTDISTYEIWAKEIGVERIDEANGIRRDTMKMLSLRNREVDAGGRVTVEAAVDNCEHQALDPLRLAGILDDPKEPNRARWRVEAGIELLSLWISGKVMSRSTAAWRAVGGGNGGGVSAEEAEGKVARAEMRYLRAMDAVGDDSVLLHAVCLDMHIPRGTKRRTLCNALDILAEFLNGVEPPADVVRPRLRVRPKMLRTC